ncbi:MAG: inorganic diphosphatase [Buchnera aphidicola (Eriosoma harunire)]
MSINNIPSGPDVPEILYAIIEISSHSYPVKYEMNKTHNELFVDRFIASAMRYPCNYGYINKTKSQDGDPLDILVYTPYPILPKTIIPCRPIGMLRMKDESGHDAKIIAVPNHHVSTEYLSIQDIHNLPTLLKQQIQIFFENYKNAEKDKWVKIIGWDNKQHAIQEIEQSIIRYQKC